MGRTWMVLVPMWVVWGCGGGGGDASQADAGEGASAEAAETAEAPDPHDPCALVSRAEMEELIGPLLEAPYRVGNNRQPDPGGEGCLYRARDYRNVTVSVEWDGGAMGFSMMAGTGESVEEILGGPDPAAAQLAGAWDKVGSAFGQFVALEGDVMVHVDPLGSRLDAPGSLRVISLAMGRLDQPLDYDGARATRTRTETGVEPRDPCSLVTRQEVEALMGPLRGDPHPSEEGDGCVFPVDQEFFGTPVERTLEVQWRDGFYALGQERQAMGMAQRTMAAHMDPDMPAVGENVAGEAEPWDERITLMGGVVTVVKRDVLLKIAGDGLAGFDEAKAEALLRSALGRI